MVDNFAERDAADGDYGQFLKTHRSRNEVHPGFEASAAWAAGTDGAKTTNGIPARVVIFFMAGVTTSQR
ncbi:hypothetical protein ABT272_43190 [Streptomyces sp900105245]|uniref:Uncharacterized protein n=1 Tax=Streptomyces sp. 900105245 TaxID=3154379 RepID=A0ABV1ULI2_9ACTN